MSLKLHLGSGWRFLPGWQHLDITKRDHIDYVGSVIDLSQFSEGTVDMIYASHLLEYFDAAEAIQVLSEWRRVLRSGGEIYLAVPDFQALLKIYERTADLGKILGPLFGKMQSDLGTIYHRTVFDKVSLFLLSSRSASVGFRSTILCLSLVILTLPTMIIASHFSPHGQIWNSSQSLHESYEVESPEYCCL